MSKIYFISEKTLRNEALIDDNVDVKFLNSAIEQSQVYLKEILDKCVYKKLEDCIINGFKEGDELYKELLDDLVTNYLLYKVCETISIPLTYKFRNQGVVSASDQHFNTVPQMKDLTYIEAHYRNMADVWKMKIQKFIEDNELACNKCEEKNLQIGHIFFRK